MSYGYHRLGANVPGKVLTAAMLGQAYAGVSAPVTIRASSPLNDATLLDSERTPSVMPKMDSIAARQQGFTGDQCDNCQSMRMKVSGHCTVCEECGTTTGCS